EDVAEAALGRALGAVAARTVRLQDGPGAIGQPGLIGQQERWKQRDDRQDAEARGHGKALDPWVGAEARLLERRTCRGGGLDNVLIHRFALAGAPRARNDESGNSTSE